MSPWSVFFHWPDGGVWGNILASIIWAAPTVFVAGWRFRAHHRKLHARLDQLDQSHADLHCKLDNLTGVSDGRDLPRRGDDHESFPQP